MSLLRQTCVRAAARMARQDDGQVLIMVAVAMLSMIGIAGLVIDVGRLDTERTQIQVAANAAALAGADELANGQSLTTAVSTAQQYSATVSDHNADGYSVTTSAQAVCLGPVTMGTSTVDCSAPYGYVAGSPCTVACNGIHVTETTSVTPWLMEALGFTSSTITASAMAADEGGNAQPVDAQVIMDTTSSMGYDDTSDPSDTCGSGGVTGIPGADLTYEDCAKAGVRALLGVLLPCDEGLSTCGSDTSGNNVADPVDRVGLMEFPAMNDCTSTNVDGTCFDDNVDYDGGYVNPGPQGTGDVGVPIETDCQTDVDGGAEDPSDPSNMTYAINSDYYGSYSNAQVVPFSSDYRSSDTATALNGGINASPLVNAVDWLDCPGGIYPANKGSGTTTSITGGNSANTTTAVDGGSSITEVGSATNALNTAVPSGGATSTPMFVKSGIGGGTTGTDVAGFKNTASASTFTLTRPTGYATDDIQIVTITAQQLSTSAVICAPTGSGYTWTELAAAVQEGSSTKQITEATFWTFGKSPSYAFFFQKTSCTSGTTGTALSSSAVAVVYSGVNTSSPFESTPLITSTWGTTTSVGPLSVTTKNANDEIVTLFNAYGTLSTTGTFGINESYSSSGANTAVDNYGPASTGASTPPSGITTLGSSDTWIAVTFALTPQLQSSIAGTAPSGSGTGALELATIDANDLSSGGRICAPTGWAPVPSSPAQPQVSGTLTQETFYSTSAPSSYTFTFETNCSGGSASTVWDATLEAVAYSGINTTSPFDGTIEMNSGAAGTSPTATAVTPSNLNDEVVSIYGTSASSSTSGGVITYAGGIFTSLPAGSVQASGTLNGSASTLIGQALVSTEAAYAPPNPATTTAWLADTIALAPSILTSISPALPSGWASGDLALATVAVRGDSSVAISPPTGWAPVEIGGSDTVTSGSGVNAVTQETFWSTLTITSTSPTFGLASGSAPTPGASAELLAFSGVDYSTPFDPGSTATTSSSGSGTTLSAPAVTTTIGDDEVVALFASGASSITGTPPPVAVNSNWASSATEDALAASAGSHTPTSATSAASDPWTAESISLEPATNITLARPDPAAAGDFILATVTTSDFPSGDTVCPPQDGTWTQLGSEITAGTGTNTLGQWTFYSFRSTANAENYPFSFVSGSSCSGTTLVPTAASAIAVRFTGVAAATPGPVDAAAGITNDSTGTSGTNVTAPGLNPTYIGEDVVSLYSSGASSFSTLNPSGGSGTSSSVPATGYGAAVETDAATSTSSETATAAASDPWIGDTIALVATNGGCYGNCSYGLEDGGGDGTYYTGVINQAAASFSSNQRTSSSASVKDAIILVSDGDANATKANLQETAGGPEIDGSNTTPWDDECQQAIAAAENAEAAGDEFYVLYYGDLTSYTQSGTCTTDTSGDATQGSYTVDIPGLSSLCAMKLIADNPVTNPTAWGGATEITSSNYTDACTGTPVTDASENFYYVTTNGSLQTAFQQVGTSLTLARLVSNAADT